ncbi:MAG: hypothetical protein CMK92_04485 [Pseudomonas sp.]|nr:hypothetical protein [Pseudomonas sp.]
MPTFRQFSKMTMEERKRFLLKNRENPPIEHPAMRLALRMIAAKRENKADLITGVEISQTSPLTYNYYPPVFNTDAQFREYATKHGLVSYDYWQAYYLAWIMSINPAICHAQHRYDEGTLVFCDHCKNGITGFPHKHVRIAHYMHLTELNEMRTFYQEPDTDKLQVRKQSVKRFIVKFGRHTESMYGNEGMLSHLNDAYNLRDYFVTRNARHSHETYQLNGAFLDGEHLMELPNLDFLENEKIFQNLLEQNIARLVNKLNLDFIDHPKIQVADFANKTTDKLDLKLLRELVIRIADRFGQPGVIGECSYYNQSKFLQWSVVENIGEETLYRRDITIWNIVVVEEYDDDNEDNLELNLPRNRDSIYQLAHSYGIDI